MHILMPCFFKYQEIGQLNLIASKIFLKPENCKKKNF